MTPLPMSKYCKRSKFGLTVQDLIKYAVDIEDKLNEKPTPPPTIPPYVKTELPLNHASRVGMASNLIRALVP